MNSPPWSSQWADRLFDWWISPKSFRLLILVVLENFLAAETPLNQPLIERLCRENFSAQSIFSTPIKMSISFTVCCTKLFILCFFLLHVCASETFSSMVIVLLSHRFMYRSDFDRQCWLIKHDHDRFILYQEKYFSNYKSQCSITPTRFGVHCHVYNWID